MKLMVLDGNSLVNRAFFGIKLLTTKDGRYTNAIYGFQNILLNLLAAHKPDAVAIAWDERAPTFRHTAYDGYKATRHGMPEELAQQMPVLKELLTDLGFVQVSKAGWEADDILGTLAAACEAAGGTTLLATGDRDSLQLVDDATTVLLATNKETIPMDPAAIQEKYGVAPPQLIEVKSLMGDASDNIPGVPGIGEKTALALVQKFGSLQGVYEHLDDKAIKPKQREKLEANKELAELSHMLGTIRKDAPIETAPEHYCRTAGDPAAAAQLLAELEMHKLTARWGLDESPAAVAASAETLPEVQPDLLPLAPEGRYDLAQNKDGSWYAVQGDSVYLLDNDRLPSLLDAAGVHGTFFVVATGYNEKYLPLLTQAAAAGHQIALHSASHEYSDIYRSSAAYWKDIALLKERIAPYVDAENIRYLRFPGGSTNTVSRRYGGKGLMQQLKTEVEQRGWQWVDWNVCAEDAVGGHPSADTIYRNVVRETGEQTHCVVLMHDSATTRTTAEALPDIIRWYTDNGYTFLTVAEALPLG